MDAFSGALDRTERVRLVGELARIYSEQLPKLPFYYTVRGDNFEHAMWLKATADHGWYWNDPRLAAPEGMDLHDYPLTDSLHFATVRGIGLFASDYGTILNVFFLIGFPLAAWSAASRGWQRAHVSIPTKTPIPCAAVGFSEAV